MAINKRGSRRITVDGIDYRWRIRRNPTEDQSLGMDPLTYAVELAEIERGGTVLVVRTNTIHTGDFGGRPSNPVLPTTVAADIRDALSRGWVPETNGSPFIIDRSEGFRMPPIRRAGGPTTSVH